jgi:hypothetical protein
MVYGECVASVVRMTSVMSVITGASMVYGECEECGEYDKCGECDEHGEYDKRGECEEGDEWEE